MLEVGKRVKYHWKNYDNDYDNTQKLRCASCLPYICTKVDGFNLKKWVKEYKKHLVDHDTHI